MWVRAAHCPSLLVQRDDSDRHTGDSRNFLPVGLLLESPAHRLFDSMPGLWIEGKMFRPVYDGFNVIPPRWLAGYDR